MVEMDCVAEKAGMTKDVKMLPMHVITSIAVVHEIIERVDLLFMKI